MGAGPPASGGRRGAGVSPWVPGSDRSGVFSRARPPGGHSGRDAASFRLRSRYFVATLGLSSLWRHFYFFFFKDRGLVRAREREALLVFPRSRSPLIGEACSTRGVG